MTTYAITGASGHLGTLVVQDLLAHDVPAADVLALVRDPAKAPHLAGLGVQVRTADYDRPETLPAALAGVDRLLLVSSSGGDRVGQHAAAIDAAVAAGVARIAYTSVLGVDTTINPVAPDHRATEAHLRASGVETVALRNGWYNENYLSTLDSAAHGGVVLTSAGDGRVASASRADYAEAAAVALLLDAPQPAYELAGDVAWTQEDLARDLSTVLGRTVEVERVTAEEHRARLEALELPAFVVALGVEVDAAIAKGELAQSAGSISALTGRPTTPLLETLRASAPQPA